MQILNKHWLKVEIFKIHTVGATYNFKISFSLNCFSSMKNLLNDELHAP